MSRSRCTVNLKLQPTKPGPKPGPQPHLLEPWSPPATQIPLLEHAPEGSSPPYTPHPRHAKNTNTMIVGAGRTPRADSIAPAYGYYQFLVCITHTLADHRRAQPDLCSSDDYESFVSLQCLLAMCLFIQLRRIKAVVLDQDTAQSKKLPESIPLMVGTGKFTSKLVFIRTWLLFFSSYIF